MSGPCRDWLEGLARPPGCFGCAVAFPEGNGVARSFEAAWPPDRLESVARNAVDTFRVLRLHQLPSRRLRWAYTGGVIHAARRSDDVVLIAIWAADPVSADDGAALELIRAFEGLGKVV